MPDLNKLLLKGILVIIGINILAMWTVHYYSLAQLSQQGSRLALLELPAEESGVAESTSSAATVADLQAELEDIKSRLTTVEEGQESSTADDDSDTTTATTETTETVAQFQEQTVYMGYGNSNSASWTDITTASIVLDTANYAYAKNVTFEATLSIVGGEVSARIKNKTTGGVITASEVTHNSSTAATKMSSTFTLPSGSNEYIVQLRSSSSEKAVLDGARLRLTN